MTTKYDWSNVPKEVKWISTDDHGNKNLHRYKPEKCINLGDWVDDVDGFYSATWRNEFKGNWQDSLEQRPGEPQ